MSEEQWKGGGIATTSGAAIPIQMSTTKQEGKGTSLQTQEVACRAYAAEHGYEVGAALLDVYTGKDTFNHSGMSELRASLRARGADLMLGYALDRVSRNQAHQGLVLSETEHAGRSSSWSPRNWRTCSRGPCCSAYAGSRPKWSG